MKDGNRDPDLWVRAILALGRVPNLPTIWSNCLAGWLLSGGGSAASFTVLWWGATFLYFGSEFLNEVCQADAGDRVQRRERPIAAGMISQESVLFLSLGCFGVGALLLVTLGKTAAFITVLLVINWILYSLIHQWTLIPPLLITSSRFLLYLLAGAASDKGLKGLTIWSGMVLACYVLVMCTMTRRDRILPGLGNWLLLLLAAPIVLALLVNGEGYGTRAVMVIALYAGWVSWCLRSVFSRQHRNVPYAASGLLPGIVLVDFLALAGATPGIMIVMMLWFLVSMAAQRLIPRNG